MKQQKFELRTRIGHLLASGDYADETFTLRYRADVGVVPPVQMTRKAIMGIAPTADHLSIYAADEVSATGSDST